MCACHVIVAKPVKLLLSSQIFKPILSNLDLVRDSIPPPPSTFHPSSSLFIPPPHFSSLLLSFHPSSSLFTPSSSLFTPFSIVTFLPTREFIYVTLLV